ncbi:MAG: DUF2283 domain-containing protein [Candidatus Aenigmatarchaeota archaeon]
MVKEAKVDYDRENDILWVYTGEKVNDSLEIDNFVIDFSQENKIVGIEIFKTSEILSKLTQIKISKNSLLNIKKASLSSYQSRELTFVIINLILMIKNERKEIPIQIPAPVKTISA